MLVDERKDEECDNLADKIDNELVNGIENLNIDIYQDYQNTSSNIFEHSEFINSDVVEQIHEDRTTSKNELPEVIGDTINNIHCNNTSNDNEESKVIVRDNENSIEDEDLHLFNSYNYWYISPELPIDLNIISAPEPKPMPADYGDVAVSKILFAIF